MLSLTGNKLVCLKSNMYVFFDTFQFVSNVLMNKIVMRNYVENI